MKNKGKDKMKKMIRSLFTAALALAALFVTGSAQAVDVPSVLSEATLWLDASDENNFAFDANGNVTKWKDLSSSHHDATPASTSPNNVTNYGTREKVNGRWAYQMGNVSSGIDMSFEKITDIRTVFWVMDIKQDQKAFFLGCTDGYDFHRGANGQYASQPRPFNQARLISCDGVTKQSSDTVPTGMHLYATILNSNASANRLSQDRSESGRNGGRALSELIIFNRELSDAEMQVVSNYLNKKWVLSMMFSDKLASDNATVPADEYGDIVVPEAGIKATAYSEQTTIAATTGSPSALFTHGSWGYIQPHTIGMWVKVDELPSSGNEKDIYGFSTNGDTNNGYKLVVTADGYLKIGRKNPNGGWNDSNYYTTSHQITAGKWFYLTVSFNRDTSIDGQPSPVAIRIYVNGSQVYTKDNGFSADLGGTSFSAFYVGAGVSFAGLYGDSAVISDADTIKSWATNPMLVELIPTGPTKVTATITADTDWSGISWDEAVEPTATLPVELTFDGDWTLTLNGAAVGKRFLIKGNSQANQSIKIAGSAEYVAAFISKVALDSTFAGNIEYEFDARTTSIMADNALKDFIKSASTKVKFVFKGANSFGATLDFSASNGPTLATHLVFEGGTHTLKYKRADQGFSTTSTAENPVVLVKGNTTLTFNANDLTNWSGSYLAGGVIRVNDGGVLNIADIGSGTFYYRQQFYLDPGATINVRDWNSNGYPGFRLEGGTSGDVIYVPESAVDNTKVVTINGNIHIHHDSTIGFGVNVGANSILSIGSMTAEDPNNASYKIVKRGAGKLVAAGDFNINTIEVADGSLAAGGTIKSVTLTKATEIEVASGTATISAISGNYAITKTGAGMLNLPAAYTQAITLSGGLIPSTAENTVTITGAIDLGTTEMPLAWTIDAASTGSIKLPAGFPFGQIAKASEVPADLTFKNSEGDTVNVEIKDGHLILPQSTINTPYNISEPTVIEDNLVFGNGGSINITHSGAMLKTTGTITLPENGLPVTFVCEKEYVVDTQVAVVIANSFKIGDNDATIDNFTCKLTGKLPKGMEGEFQLVDDEGGKALVFAITKSDYYTADVAKILENASLIRRFDASRGVTTGDNNKVTAWADLCGTTAARGYTAGNVNDQPVYVNGELREYLDFGAPGSNIDLEFDKVSDAKTIIQVIDIANDKRAFLMGCHNSYDYHRGQQNAGSVTYFNGDKNLTIRYNGVAATYDSVVPTGFGVISLASTNNSGKNTDCFAADRNGCGNDDREGGRKLSEVLIFDAVLTADQLKTVEDYLTAKWNLALKNEAAISGAKAWSDITWKAGKFYADVATEITLEGNTVLTYDAAAPVGNITFFKDDYTLEQVVTSATGLSGAFTVPAGETFVFKGGEASGDTFTYTSAITVNGTLKTDGYVNLNANNAVSGGTLEVVNGQATLKFASQGISGGGTLTIDAGATAVAASGDAFSYADNASFTLNVYGALDMGGNRWTYKGSSGALNIYGGAEISGTGDGNGALDMYIPINAAVNGSSTEATVSAPFKYSADTTFNVGDGMTLKLTGAVKSNQTKTLTKTGAGTLKIGASQGNVTVAANAGKVVLDNASYVKSVSTSGTGSVEIAGGEYDVGQARDFNTIGNITTSGEGKIKVVAAVADDGTVKIVNVPAGLAVEVYDIGGVDKLETVYTEGTITATCSIKVDGAACYYDWTFTNTVQTTGAKTIATSAYSQNQASLEGDLNTSYADRNEEDLYTSLYTSVRPWADLNWSSVGRPWTIALAGKMSEYPNTVFISLGGANKTFFFSTTDTPNEVRLVYGTNQNKCEEVTVMSVPAASTLVHVYEITLSADGKDLTVYLDGLEWASSHKEEGFEMINGIQVSGWFQGNYFSSGYKRDGDSGQTDTDKVGRIKMLRVYNSILGPKAMAKLSEEFPYNPQFGAYSRTLDEEAETWSATEAWMDDEDQSADIPVDGSVANLTVGINSELTINAGEEIHQESITIVGQDSGGQTLRIKAGTGEIINDGATIITTPVTIEYGAMTIAGGPTKINGNGSVTFDFSNYPIETVFSEGHLGLTGLCDAPEGEDKSTWPVKLIVPEDLKGRKMTLEYTANNKYELVYGFERDQAATLYLTESATLSDTTLFATEEGGEAWMPRLFEGDVIYVKEGLTATLPATDLTLKAKFNGAGTVAVSGKTLKNSAPLFSVEPNWTGTVEFTDLTMAGSGDAANWFDLNPYGNANSKVKLAGAAGYMRNGETFAPEVILENTDSLAGIHINNGSGNTTLIFRKVSGTGNFVGTNDVKQRIAIGDASTHTGQVRMEGGKGITLGSTANTAGDAQIVVANGATINFANQEWIATNGITFGDTLKVVGEINKYITMPEPNKIPGVLNADGNVSTDLALKYESGKLVIVGAGAQVNGKSYDSVEEAIKSEGGTAENPTAITITKDTNVAVEKMTEGNFFTIAGKSGSEKFRWTDATGDAAKYIVCSEAGVFTVKLGTPDNGLDSYANFALNLKNKAEDGGQPDKPFIKQVGGDVDTITFNFFHGTDGNQIVPRTGITVEYAVEYADSLDFSNPSKVEKTDENPISVGLPTDKDKKVRYYRPKFSFE